MIPLARPDLSQLRTPRRTRLQLIRDLLKVRQERAPRLPAQTAACAHTHR
jgi:hypothetical protein